jgi:hypothetical protein
MVGYFFLFYFKINFKFFFHFLIKINLLSIKLDQTSKLKSLIFSSLIYIAPDFTAFLAFEFDFSNSDLTIVSNKFSFSKSKPHIAF